MKTIFHKFIYFLSVKNKVACVILACFALVPVMRVNAEEHKAVFTLEECVEIGLERSGRLKNAFRDREIGNASVGEARSRLYPGVSVNASYLRTDELDKAEFGDQMIEMGALDQYSVSFLARQLLYSGGSVSAGLRAARDYSEMMDYEYARERAELIRDIHAGFADLLLLESVVEVHKQSVEQLRAMEKQADALFKNERASEFDVLNARVQVANALPDLISAENDFALAKASFRNLINLEEDEFSVEGKLEYKPFKATLEEITEAALVSRPEIMALERMVSLRSADVRAEQGAYQPSLYLTGNYSAQDPPGAMASGSGWEWRWTAGLEAQWTILDGGLRRHSVVKKKVEREKAKENLSILLQAVELEARRAFLKVAHAAEAVAVSGENVELAERSLEIAEARYKTGLITRLEFTDVNLALMKARLNRLYALREHVHAVNEAEYAAGRYTGDG